MSRPNPSSTRRCNPCYRLQRRSCAESPIDRAPLRKNRQQGYEPRTTTRIPCICLVTRINHRSRQRKQRDIHTRANITCPTLVLTCQLPNDFLDLEPDFASIDNGSGRDGVRLKALNRHTVLLAVSVVSIHADWFPYRRLYLVYYGWDHGSWWGGKRYSGELCPCRDGLTGRIL